MIGYIKTAAALLFVGFLIAAGWQVHSWRTEAARAKVLATELAAERIQHQVADRAREKLARELEEAKENVRVEIRNVIKRIPQFINRDDCSLSVDGVRALNLARGLSSTPDTTTHETVTAGTANRTANDNR